jgi:hypothetical protein
MIAFRFEASPIFPTSRLKAREKMAVERRSEKTTCETMRTLPERDVRI